MEYQQNCQGQDRPSTRSPIEPSDADGFQNSSNPESRLATPQIEQPLLPASQSHGDEARDRGTQSPDIFSFEPTPELMPFQLQHGPLTDPELSTRNSLAATSTEDQSMHTVVDPGRQKELQQPASCLQDLRAWKWELLSCLVSISTLIGEQI